MNDLPQFALPEAVTFDNLSDLRELAEDQLDEAEASETFRVIVGDLGHGGSAAVALMIALFRRAHIKGKKICFTEVPLEIGNIINVSGLSDVLPIEVAEPATISAE